AATSEALGKAGPPRQTAGNANAAGIGSREGITHMRQSWLCSGLLSLPLLMATGGIAAAQDHAHGGPAADAAGQAPAAMRQVRWSDPSAWPDGRVPAA